ncbi:MAG: hypothetical protein ACRYE8_06970 [Janthinobacterium lividum]
MRATESGVAILSKCPEIASKLCFYKALLRRSKNVIGVIPWLDHGIQKIIKNTNFISIFNWI